MVPLKQIKKGITSGDWQLVVNGYNALTGESLSVPSNSSGVKLSLPEIISALQEIAASNNISHTEEKSVPLEQPKPAARPAKRGKKSKNTKLITDALTNINAEINVDQAPTGLPSSSRSIKDTPVIAYSPDDVDEDVLESNQKIAVKKNARPEYKPYTINCGCGKSYDGNKCIKGHILGNASEGTTKYKCPHCKVEHIE